MNQPPTNSSPKATADATTSITMQGVPSAQVRVTRHAALAFTLALIALGLAWELVLAPTGARTLALKVIPLALCVVGLAKYRMTTYRWMSLLVWLYFAEGSMRAASDRGIAVPLAWVEVVLATALFVACALHVRARLASGRVAPLPTTQP
jgi:uncharacterized membrane protein